ncbi:uncharacterized protein LOC129566096 isoform X2 [Sitodiplosis mosellana]|uniref:uncharacterized protein LOC129566096 isoform X2 n=1 Tax=Sitodiplosis mosellana TaxID=263140 RepID=UPI0024449597|nr:uncharacterized protein LOC129566096 isoform X2 [Sitodiplosis mosellana]XP_055297638.1 uncharacterized protein LOC129566096 isoform X2 [Sitodiplosis mosellana]XP_055297639.1 uncharacterized protein LOC129566096 isoform X2 [Sitodiplosis mosellana]XP_055297640.1 uncharacterized protein LOC129566096 isoform X2 [Sitodiplosis mosellana]
MEAPSMVHRSGDKLIIRSVVSGDQLYLGGQHSAHNSSDKSLHDKLIIADYHDPTNDSIEEIIDNNNLQSPSSAHDKKDDDSNLPQCKIKRNYSCNNCSFFTQNPRHFLAHLRDIHGEKIIINECKHCLYASRHYQKLVRHMKMVHGSTDGLEEQAQSRKRASQLAREEKKRKIQILSGAGSSSTNVTLNDSFSVLQAAAAAAAAVAAASSGSPGMVNNNNNNNNNNSNNKSLNASSAASQSNAVDATNQMSAEVLNQKFLKCTLCDYTTLYRTQMVEHEREEHNKTKFFRCQKCSYVTHIKARFSKHVKYHSMPMIKCVMCDFRTPYKWNLDRHMKNHGGAGPFKCSACNFTADIKQSLTVHEMNHHVPPVGHATGMSMARRRNKVGGTDLMDADYGIMNIGDNSDGEVGDGMDNNNSDDNYDGSDGSKRAKYENDLIEEYQSSAADLSNKSTTPVPTPPKKAVRPLPNLIPIQPTTSADAMNLSTRSKKNEWDFAAQSNKIWGSIENLFGTEIAKSKKQESVLKDLASLFVSEEVFDGSETSQLSPVSNASSAKRKNTNFFNELKEKFASGSRDLMCECGHTSKCLSEAIIHKKSCRKNAEKQSVSPVNLIIANLGTSTRCQYCRHRCKTSADLYVHLQSCAEARTSAESCDSASEVESNNEKLDVNGELTDEGMIDLTNEPHPMENKVFVWNKLPQQQTAISAGQPQPDPKPLNDIQTESATQIDNNDDNDDEKADDSTYFGIETAPGYGEVTKKMNPNEEAMHSSLKKVFKCPHCSFWASTASRFHVHIVGHLNKKPFECSLCSYRSNWRWDITKHIRLKTIRDASHKSAKVLMNDETGRRNYTKYNRYITLMKVTDEDGDPKHMKSGEMTPSQEATLQRRKPDIDHSDEDRGALAQNALLYSISNNQFNSSADNDDDKQNDNDTNTKKVSFKCKKCNFRHSNRDVVLQHVKGHYKDANIPIDDQANGGGAAVAGLNANEFNNNVYVNGILSALSPSATKLLIQHPQLSQQAADQTQIRIQALNQLSGNSSHLFLAELKQQQQQQQPIPSINTQNVNVNANQSSIALQTPAIASQNQSNPSTSIATNENGEMDERHCRLKHDGDIQIEIKIKGSNDAYQPLTLHNTTNATSSSSSTNNAPTVSQDINVAGTSSASTSVEKESLSYLTKQYPIKLPVISDANKSATDANAKETISGESSIQAMDADQRNLLINLLKSNPILCNGNVLALIKSSAEFRCQLCNFEAPNEAILAQHIQMHLSGENSLISLIARTSDKNTAIDLDDAIITSKVPNKAFTRDGNNDADSSKQRISERQVLSNGKQNDKSSPEKSNREEKCPHCPFTTSKSDVLKEHMMCHICVSGRVNLANCNFCDYSIADETLLPEHSRIHFGLIKSKQKPVAFYTSYDNLEITTIDQQNNNNSGSGDNNNDTTHQNPYANVKTLYPKISFDLQYSSDKENKILVDTDTGHVIK